MTDDAGLPPRIDEETLSNVRKLESVRPGLLDKLLTMFAANARRFLDGVDAAVAAGDVEAVRAGCHSLRGTSAGIGAQRLSHYCRKAEDLATQGHADERLSASVAEIREEFFAVCRHFGLPD